MNKLTIKWLRQYHKLNKKSERITMNVYSVTDGDIEGFKAAQGEYYREDEDKNPVWISPKYVGETGTLIITSKGKVVPDTSEMDKAMSIVAQYGGNLGHAIAQALAAKLVGTTVVTPVSATTDEPIDSLE